MPVPLPLKPEQYQNLLEKLPDGYLVLSSELSLIYLNDCAQNLLIPDKKKYVGRKLTELKTHSEALEHIAQLAQEVLKSRDKKSSHIRFPAQKEKVWFVRLNPGLEKGKLVSISGMITDITEVRLEEEALMLSRDEALQKERMRLDFLSNMSHELRNPLNAITGFASFLKSENISLKERYRNLDHILHNSQKLQRIVDTILDVSRIDQGEMRLTAEEVYVNSIVEEVYRNNLRWKEQAGKQNLPFIFKTTEPDMEALIYTDGFRLFQVLDNLVNNALKFTEEGLVEMGYEKVNEKLYRFYVKDSGIGIQKEHLQLVFNRFHQEDEGYVKKYGGSGLGLSLARQLCLMMNGKIWLESETGEGTTAWVEIPVGEKPEEPFSDKPSAEKQYNWSGRNILIVDDMREASTILSRVVRNYQAESIIADSGKKAEELVRSYPEIDLVLMDIQMPDQDGITTTRHIKAMRPELKILAQTAYALIGDKELFLEAGCDDYITKPVVIPDLCAKIDQLLGD